MQVAALEAAARAADMLAAKAGGAASALEVALKVLTREVGLMAAESQAESAAHGNAAPGGGPQWRQAPALAPRPGTGGSHTSSQSHLQSRVRLGGLDDLLSQ